MREARPKVRFASRRRLFCYAGALPVSAALSGHNGKAPGAKTASIVGERRHQPVAAADDMG
jgi:hypothetical protein